MISRFELGLTIGTLLTLGVVFFVLRKYDLILKEKYSQICTEEGKE